MIRNYVTTTLRYIKKEPGYTLLNILGLTVGITACLLIFLFVRYETSYDVYHERGERIFRISSDIREPDNAFRWAVTQFPVGKTVKTDFAEVEEYVRFFPNGISNVEIGDKNFVEEDFYFVDSTVFDIFTFDLVTGEANEALKAPNSIVLSQSMAEKFFGTENPMGQQLKIDNEDTYKVTGVYKDMPNRSHLIATALMSASNHPQYANTNWGGFNIYTYVLLHSADQAVAFEEKLEGIIEKHVNPIFEALNIKIHYELINLYDIHLHSNFEAEPEPTGNISYIYIFSAIGLFMLIIASINFINLSTARSSQRALEVGIRKVLGSYRWQLIAQFLVESVVVTLLALMISIGLIWLLIPVFNSMLDLQLDTSMLRSGPFILALLSIVFLVGILGGSYPAFFLSGFKPIAVLKGKYAKGSAKNPLRKLLVVVQFAVSLFLLIGTGIIYEQLNYVKTQDLGFDKEQVLAIPFTFQEQREKWPVLRSSFLNHPEITSVGSASTAPGDGYPKNVMNIELNDGSFDDRGVDFYGADFDYVETIGLDIVQGRSFSREFSTDSTLAVLANEAMVRRMGWEEPIGKRIKFYSGEAQDTIPFMKVVGVIKDYHHRSLYNPIDPIIVLPRFNNRLGLVKMETSQLSETLASLEQDWQSLFPTTPFEYYFIDEEFQSQYEEDEKRGMIFMIFSGLAILIAILGLLGLASYVTVLRTKEISVRKILGAETRDILGLMTREYLWLVLFATIPAFVLAWYLMRQWLESFTYHTSINFLIFIAAFVGISLITFLTTGFFAVRAAQLNPADTLKDE